MTESNVNRILYIFKALCIISAAISLMMESLKMTIRTDKVKRANQKLMIRKNNIETTILFLWCIILV